MLSFSGKATCFCIAAKETDMVRSICTSRLNTVVNLEWFINAISKSKIKNMATISPVDVFGFSDLDERSARMNFDYMDDKYISFEENNTFEIHKNLGINTLELIRNRLVQTEIQIIGLNLYNIFRGVTASFLEDYTNNPKYTSAKLFFIAKGGHLANGVSNLVVIDENVKRKLPIFNENCIYLSYKFLLSLAD